MSHSKYISNMSGESNNCKSLIKHLGDWKFSDYPKYLELPYEEIKESNNRPRLNIPEVIFSEVMPDPLDQQIKLVCYSEDALTNILNIHPDLTRDQEFIDFVSGRKFPHGALPVAHRYGGHQFGVWAGQLGDGRAHLLGEYINRIEERWELQLKGSGRTPFARGGDGRAVLRSSLREMVASEACHFLGIPTTRAAALIVSDECVVRDQFYRGTPRRERAAVLLRLAPSWFRIGSLEILARNNELDSLKLLADFVIREHYPDIPIVDENRYIRFFSEVAHRSMDLVAKWQGFGFAHGVLNTDNTSLLGLALDYGPFGFADSYDSGFVPNNSDKEGRYSLAKQPDVMIWNMGQLASALSPLLNHSQRLHISHIIKTLDTYCKNKILEMFLLKLGLKEERWRDEQLVEKLLEMMQQTGADFTMTFNQLTETDPCDLQSENVLEKLWSLKRLSSHVSWSSWVESYRERLDKEAVESHSASTWSEERVRRMRSANPRYVPRNWMLHQAIVAAEKDDFSQVRFLLEVFNKPYQLNEEAERRGFSEEPPRWNYGLKVSCSS